uniref:Zgc:162608 n=2 Tax=Myripristis murdjan TaxID=586833 RepID=A0A667YBL5_9TELE
TNRDVAWANPKANQAQEKAELSKDVDKAYKSHLDSSGLYSQEDDHSKNPMVEDMQRKLNKESERLRARLRQELAELRERLSSYPVHPSSALVNLRERLAPLTQQLQSSLSSSTQDLCSQLNLYLQGLEMAAQTDTSPALYREAFQWISQTLEHSGSKLADIISDFQTKTSGVIDHLREISANEGEGAQEGVKSQLWQEISSRFTQEVSLLRLEVQSNVGALKAELAALLVSAEPLKAEVAASMDRFCQSAILQNQALQARIERLFLDLEGELELQGASSLSPSSSSRESGSALQEDFSARFSALIQDILHSVQ